MLTVPPHLPLPFPPPVFLLLRKGKGNGHKGRADEEGETVTTVTAQLSDIVGGDAGSAAFVLLPADAGIATVAVVAS